MASRDGPLRCEMQSAFYGVDIYIHAVAFCENAAAFVLDLEVAAWNVVLI